MSPSTVYYAAMSLDGYIADADEGLDWLMGFEPTGYGGEGAAGENTYEEFFAGVGAMTMGSRTYEWIGRNVSWPYGATPAWIYTSRGELEELEGAEGVRFTSGSVAELHAEQLEAAAGKDLWVVGGGELASQYVAAGLLDSVRLTVVPTILDGGYPLFAEPLPRPMRLTAANPLASGMLDLSYELI
jgi:dihydrofolate reductase